MKPGGMRRRALEREDECVPHGESKAFVSRWMNKINVLGRGD